MAETVRSAATPLRESAHELEDGCHLLAPNPVRYLDGAESRLLEVVSKAHDLSSLSDELAAQALTWPERYHLSEARANVLRGLELDAGMKVLEIGAGCGAVTRYLGEACSSVDALEPMLERARVARARTRDLPNVELFVGRLEDVPEVATYDLIVVIGVLEYVAGGSADPAAYGRFLDRVRATLAPGGSLVVAIENALGVKYLAGAAEDHVGRAYASVEGYPGGAPARTFSRLELSNLLHRAGLEPFFLQAFPDYKVTRALLSDDLLASEPALAWRIPQFPSPDFGQRQPSEVSEQDLWRSLVKAGLGGQFGNSFLVIASGERPPRDLWPRNRLASFFQPMRGSRYATQTDVVRDGREIHFRRRKLRTGTGLDGSSLVFHVPSSELVRGTDLIEVLAESSDEEIRAWLGKWLQLLDERIAVRGSMPIDLLPHNMVVASDGTLADIDQEWERLDYTRQDLLARAAYLTGTYLAARTPASRWPFATVRELVAHLGSMVGLSPRGEWIDDAVSRESELQARIAPHDVGGEADGQVREIELGLKFGIEQRLEDLPLGKRDHERMVDLAAQAARDREEVRTMRAQVEGERAAVREVLGSTSWRATRPLRALGRSVRRARGGGRRPKDPG